MQEKFAEHGRGRTVTQKSRGRAGKNGSRCASLFPIVSWKIELEKPGCSKVPRKHRQRGIRGLRLSVFPRGSALLWKEKAEEKTKQDIGPEKTDKNCNKETSGPLAEAQWRKDGKALKQKEFDAIENYMLQCMEDSAHDREHVYRVLHTALGIAETEPGADLDILIAACLLHDIGSEAQYKDPAFDHAKAGAEMARGFLLERGWPGEKAEAVSEAVLRHRFRSSGPPESLEAKILFDADKLDVTGAMGIARTLLYQGRMGIPLYHVDTKGRPVLGEEDPGSSFFQEYAVKLKNLYGRFYTKRGRELAGVRQSAARAFYESLWKEVCAARGIGDLNPALEEE